ncbi:hypothetical protein Clacol_003734 [Clathrus columnatus]|uniref:Nudix hydrolase domain-containing protein n=1 Tax=Clathrus columnatus TaxID=1419009 RepID=A0AAV5A4C9_9AGAM|nr:hypothetical protein Clacol_003734 [Clathrus columnatus]
MNDNEPRRAAVAIILRILPPPDYPLPISSGPSNLADFFKLDWVNAKESRAEILFIHRRKGDISEINRSSKEAHVAFPGGRMEEGDEGGHYTAMRQTWEEIGLDLAEKDFICVGQLDDREITTSLGKRLLMILSPFVFLQVTPNSISVDPPPETTIHWIPLSKLVRQRSIWSYVTVDVASRLTPKHSWVKILVRILVGSMQFSAIILNASWKRSDQNKNEKSQVDHNQVLKLWGLTLGMTLDLLACMPDSFSPSEKAPGSPTDYAFTPHPIDTEHAINLAMTPSLTSVFPRFSYPDVNFWIWVFGKRYREVVRGWEASVQSGGSNDKRINWAGTALNTFYAAVRKALVVVIILRALGVLLALGVGSWWLWGIS